MADVINPGTVQVADEVYKNPNPNGGNVLRVPEQLDELTDAADQGFPPAVNGVDASVFPTPAEVDAGAPVPSLPVLSSTVPDAAEVIVDNQVIGQGVWLPVDPLDPSAGKRFVAPGEFIVVGPDQSIQTNNAEATTVLCTITAVYDADNLWSPATSTTTRFLLAVAPPALTSYPISILGRQIVFADDTLTSEDAGAVRNITGYSTNYVVVDNENPNDPNVPSLVVEDPPGSSIFYFPQAGDTFWLDVQREGAQDISRVNSPTIDVVIAPPPQAFMPSPNQALAGGGTANVSTGPQPGTTIITSGTAAPTAINVQVADQATSVGLPINVNI